MLDEQHPGHYSRQCNMMPGTHNLDYIINVIVIIITMIIITIVMSSGIIKIYHNAHILPTIDGFSTVL